MPDTPSRPPDPRPPGRGGPSPRAPTPAADQPIPRSVAPVDVAPADVAPAEAAPTGAAPRPAAAPTPTDAPRYDETWAVEAAAGRLCRRWKPAIVWSLALGPQRFNALAAALPGVTPKVLTEQLRELTRDGLVSRVMCIPRDPRTWSMS
jgi:hypothetical protein